MRQVVMKVLRIRKTRYGSAGVGYRLLIHIWNIEIALFPDKKSICATKVSILTPSAKFKIEVGIRTRT